MNITLTGFRGIADLIFVFIGGGAIIAWALGWLEDRFTVSFRSLCVRRRWDRPGARVVLFDGREGAIEEVWRDAEAGDIALVIFDGAAPEFVPVVSLAPFPAVAREAAHG